MKLTTAPIAMMAILLAAAVLLTETLFDEDGVAAVPQGRVTAEQVPRSSRSRIEVLVMENQSYQNVIGSANAPYTNRLTRRYGLATRMFAVTHPSLPNYLAMTTGKTYGIQTDFPKHAFPGPDLMTQLGSVGSTWNAYYAGVPKSCYTGPNVAGYSRGLNPFAVSRRILASPRSCSNLKPMSRLSSGLRSGTLPDLAWISPSLTEDSHDSSVKAGDIYLAKTVPALMRSLGPKGALFILWDEGKTSHSKGKTSIGIAESRGGGHIPAIVVGPGVRHGARTSTPMTLYSVLHFMEHSFGLPYLNHAAKASDSPLRSLFTTPPSPHQG